jgi:Mg-chelatase subunit ChlD
LVLIGAAWFLFHPRFYGAYVSSKEVAELRTNALAAIHGKETELAQRRLGLDPGRASEQERLKEELTPMRRYGLVRPSAPTEPTVAAAPKPVPTPPVAALTLPAPPTVYLPTAGPSAAAGQTGAPVGAKPEFVGVLEGVEARPAAGTTLAATESRGKSLKTSDTEAAGRIVLTDRLNSIKAPTAGFPVAGGVEKYSRGKEQLAEWDVGGQVAAGDGGLKFGGALAMPEAQPGAAAWGMRGYDAYFSAAEAAPGSLFSERYGGQGGFGGSGQARGEGGGVGGYGGGAYGGASRQGLQGAERDLAAFGKQSAPAPEGGPRAAGAFKYYFDNGRAAGAASDLGLAAAKSKEQAKFRDLARSEGRQAPQLGDTPLLGTLFKTVESGEKQELAEAALAKGHNGVHEKFPGVRAAEPADASKPADEKKAGLKAVAVGVPAPETAALALALEPAAPAAVPAAATAAGKEAGSVNGPAAPAAVALRALAEPAQQVTEERARGVKLAVEQGGRVEAEYEGKELALKDSAGVPLAPTKQLAERPAVELGRLALAPRGDAARKFVAAPDAALKDAAAEARPVKKSPPAPPPPPEISTLENPFSTFSLNVSDVSFKLAAASLDSGAMPEPAAIRAEEFINAFNYHDPAPARGARLAFAWERARYPFAHNRDVLRFAIQTPARGREPGKPLNLVVLLDNSGSMERPDRVLVVREALSVLAQQLQPQDRISVVAFARTPRLWVDGMAGGEPQALLNKVLELNPYGGTNLELAMALAYATAEKHFLPAGNNRVILLTDGAANLGDVEPESLKRTVEEHRRKGLALDCFGIGWEGYNDDLLEVLARHGDGRYGFLNDPEQAGPEFADQLAGALNVAAADVKAQVEFNPRRVLAYRQIGYARHQLTKEQFRDNTVDAAEIGAAESGNALYVIQINPQGAGPLGVVRVRYKVPFSGQYVEQQWGLAYEPVVPPLERASPALRLAAVAASFAEWLARSPYAAEVTPAALQSVMRGVPETYAPDPRPQRLALMLQQARAISGQ